MLVAAVDYDLDRWNKDLNFVLHFHHCCCFFSVFFLKVPRLELSLAIRFVLLFDAQSASHVMLQLVPRH